MWFLIMTSFIIFQSHFLEANLHKINICIEGWLLSILTINTVE